MRVAVFGGTGLLALMLGGCVVAPVEPGPVVYAAPPPAAVIVRPAPHYHYHRYHGRYRYWR
jgi:hypothetical protein